MSPRTSMCAASLAWLLATSIATAADGDFVHQPADEQKVDTPLPVYVEYPAGSLGRVVLKYAGTGVKTWSRVEMKRMGAGWGALIPCGSVTAGAMRYWIQGFDPDGEPVASARDPAHPFVVPIREALSSKAPHLPGRAAPQTCDGEPAADAAEASRPIEAPPPKPRSVRESDVDQGEEPGGHDFARWWIGVYGAVDFLSLPAGNDLCALTSAGEPANEATDYCTSPDGADFPARTAAGAAQNAALVKGSAGQLPGGLVAGDLRAFAGVDYAVTSSILVGGRLGYVLNAYPTSGAAVTDRRALGAHVHVEARATYVFGDEPLAHLGFAPTVFGAAGVSEFDGHRTSLVSFATSAGHPVVNEPVDVWRTDGPWFVAAGGGVRYQFSVRAAFTGLARVNVAFGGVGALFTFGPEIGFAYGF